MKRYSVLIGLLIICGYGKAQSLTKFNSISTTYCPTDNNCFYLQPTTQITIKERKPICVYPVYASRNDISKLIIKPNTYVNTLGLFCQQELKLDKITPLPFRFRLGSLEYVNWLEQKPNAIKTVFR